MAEELVSALHVNVSIVTYMWDVRRSCSLSSAESPDSSVYDVSMGDLEPADLYRPSPRGGGRCVWPAEAAECVQWGLAAEGRLDTVAVLRRLRHFGFPDYTRQQVADKAKNLKKLAKLAARRRR